MLNFIVNWLNGLPKELTVMLVGALPVSELRGGIPLGLYYGMPLYKAFLLAVIGNIIIIVPGLFLLKPVSTALRKFPFWSRFFDWLFEKTKKKADQVQRYESLGLMLFVAVPLPMTGAWSGIIAATLFKIRFRYAFTAIITGVLCAGLIVSLLCNIGIYSWRSLIK